MSDLTKEAALHTESAHLDKPKWLAAFGPSDPLTSISPLEVLAEKQTKNPHTRILTKPFEHVHGGSGLMGKARPNPVWGHLKPTINPCTLPYEVQLDCAIAWLGHHGEMLNDHDLQKMLKHRHKGKPGMDTLSLDDIGFIRLWFERSGECVKKENMQLAAQLRRKVNLMDPDGLLGWKFDARQDLIELAGPEVEQEIRDHRIHQAFLDSDFNIGPQPQAATYSEHFKPRRRKTKTAEPPFILRELLKPVPGRPERVEEKGTG